jgi:uncharacterized protein
LKISDITDTTTDTVRNIGAYVSGFTTPTVRLGVTGLARAGKTVFITALVRNLIMGGRLPFFAPMAEGRIARAYLEPQPNDAVPRFSYEEHLASLAADPPNWPESTRRISQLRLTLDYKPAGTVRRTLGSGRLHLDIVDYPGEWLLDLPLLDQSFDDWARDALASAKVPEREAAARDFLAFSAALDPNAPQDEQTAIIGARLYTAYLAAARAADHALSTLGPGRFLMPGELDGSPLLTFFPLPLAGGSTPKSNSLGALLDRRFESYKTHVVKPFFRDHFSRLDRQVVLVDALSALNAGPRAVKDLEHAMSAVLTCFRPGANTWLSSLFSRRIDRLLFAATKADHLHHESHDRLEATMRLITDRAITRAEGAGAGVKVLALAALRATREAEVRTNGEVLPCIIGVPLAGEKIGADVFDGRRETAVFPGDLPEDPSLLLANGFDTPATSDISMMRFRPPRITLEAPTGASDALPHIRLDRALDFLLGDHLA